MKKQQDRRIFFCHSCRTGLRLKNVKFHESRNHKVTRHDVDPRRKSQVTLDLGECGEKNKEDV